MVLHRPFLTAAGGVLAILLVCVGGVAYMRLSTGPLEARLVREANALAQASYTRPSHVLASLPGTFARHVEPLMEPVLQLYHERQKSPWGPGTSLGQPCRDVADGKLPTSSLSPACEEMLARGHVLMEQVLLATHAEVGGLPEGLGALAPFTHARADGRFALMYVVNLAALETRLHLAKGQPSEAVDTCLDALALSRELELGGGMEGQLLSVTGHGVLYRPCAEALDAAPVERKRTALTQLMKLAEGFAPFSMAMRSESILVQLVHFRGLLSEEALASLPPGCPDLYPAEIREMLSPEDSSLGQRRSWWKTVEMFDALMASADLPAGARRRAFALLEESEDEEWDTVDGPEVATYGEYAERLDVRRLQHDALLTLVEVDLARAERGHWPETPPPHKDSSFVLERIGPMEARLQPCSRAYTSQALRVTADLPPTAGRAPSP